MRWNDEPVLAEDGLGHWPLVRQVAQLAMDCQPPFVMGVCGSWGSGKTSFMRKLWAALGGAFDLGENDPTQKKDLSEDAQEELRLAKRKEWWGADHQAVEETIKHWQVLWFSPWHHQFESNPLVALLQELRDQMPRLEKWKAAGGKIADVTSYALFNALLEGAKNLKVNFGSPKELVERGEKYEAAHFDTPLTSQRFRAFFEEVVKKLTGEGRLIIFIDDLDRCEGEVAFRLLEALKLYLNTRNCIFVLGMDQAHLERSIAQVLSGEKNSTRHRPQAHEYMSKMLQFRFILPVPERVQNLIETLLGGKALLEGKEMLPKEDKEFLALLLQRFALTDPTTLAPTLAENLPHNPRKIKAFLATWRVYVHLLADARPLTPVLPLDWRVTLILNYLMQFEEPLYRQVEIQPSYYTEEILRFCKTGQVIRALFEGLEILPVRTTQLSTDQAIVEEPPSPPSISPTSGNPVEEKKPEERPVSPRLFWAAPLVRALEEIDEDHIRYHLLGADFTENAVAAGEKGAK